MTPIDPVTPAPDNDRSPMDNPFDEDNPNLLLVEQGMEVADDETRDAMADAYEEDAADEEDADEALDDIDYDEAEGDSEHAPELQALHDDPP